MDTVRHHGGHHDEDLPSDHPRASSSANESVDFEIMKLQSYFGKVVVAHAASGPGQLSLRVDDVSEQNMVQVKTGNPAWSLGHIVVPSGASGQSAYQPSPGKPAVDGWFPSLCVGDDRLFTFESFARLFAKRFVLAPCPTRTQSEAAHDNAGPICQTPEGHLSAEGGDSPERTESKVFVSMSGIRSVDIGQHFQCLIEYLTSDVYAYHDRGYPVVRLRPQRLDATGQPAAFKVESRVLEHRPVMIAAQARSQADRDLEPNRADAESETEARSYGAQAAGGSRAGIQVGGPGLGTGRQRPGDSA
eukprot:963847-Rhodomonas_salina.2